MSGIYTEFSVYEVRQGDCISSIAERAGLKWEKVWNHPNNQPLREKRKDPNILFPGDKVAVPKIKIKEENGQTEQKHKFVKLSNKAKVKLRLLQENEPRAHLSYLFVVDGKEHEGKTDGQGYLTVYVLPTARKGRLIVTDKNGVSEEYEIQLGHLDPLNEIEGWQKRLRNLGFDCPLNGRLDDKTKAAISAFCAKHKLKTDEPNDEFRQALKSKHGS